MTPESLARSHKILVLRGYRLQLDALYAERRRTPAVEITRHNMLTLDIYSLRRKMRRIIADIRCMDGEPSRAETRQRLATDDTTQYTYPPMRSCVDGHLIYDNPEDE